MEVAAYNYLCFPDPASTADRDSFAMYYLQYREIRHNKADFDTKAALHFLFPNLLETQGPEEQEKMLAEITTQFDRLDSLLPDLAEPLPDGLDETNRQLQFLVNKLGFMDKAEDELITLTLINRALVMSMKTGKQLTKLKQINKVQEQTIAHLSTALTKMNELPAATMGANVEAMSSATKKGGKQQFRRLQAILKKAYEFVLRDFKTHESLLNDDKPIFGQSILESEYNSASLPRKIYLTITKVAKVLGPILSWLSLIGTILASQGILEALCIILGVGTSLTGIGLAFLIGSALLCLGWNLLVELYEKIGEIKEISDSNRPYWTRAKEIAFIVLKSFGIALARTFFVDYFLNALASLFAFEPLIFVRNELRVWPPREQVDSEYQQLSTLKTGMEALQNLMIDQMNFIIKKENSEDQSVPIRMQMINIKKVMDDLQHELKALSPNDARLTERLYAKDIESYENHFALLKQEFDRLDALLEAQASFVDEVSKAIEIVERKQCLFESQSKEQSKAAVVDLSGYKTSLEVARKQPDQLIPQTLQSRFWTLFGDRKAHQNQSAELTESFVFVESILEETSRPVEKLGDSFFNSWAMCSGSQHRSSLIHNDEGAPFIQVL
jgi:hypothetical protein